MRHAVIIVLLVTWFIATPSLADHNTSHLSGRKVSPIGGDSQYTLALGGQVTPSWSRSDEAWYRQNRRIAAMGKVMTVLGLALTLSSLIPEEQLPLFASGIATQYLGQLIWSAAELRGAKQMQRRGFHVGKAPAIVALCGAFLLSPLTWIAGPIQSSQIRRAHGDMMFARSATGPSFSSYGLGFRGTF
jgi:hypothetical protein